MLIKSHINFLIHTIVFNISPQTQSVAWLGLEFGFKKWKTATKAEMLGSWLGSRLRGSMAWLGSLLDNWSRLDLVESWLNGLISTQWFRGLDLEYLGSGSQLSGSKTWLDLGLWIKRIKKCPTIFYFLFFSCRRKKKGWIFKMQKQKDQRALMRALRLWYHVEIYKLKII